MATDTHFWKRIPTRYNQNIGIKKQKMTTENESTTDKSTAVAGISQPIYNGIPEPSDWSNVSEVNAWLDARETRRNAAKPPPTPPETQAAAPSITPSISLQPKKPETAEHRIKILEKVVADKRKAFNAGKFDKEKFDELDTLATELRDLEARNAKEIQLKNNYRRKYAESFITDGEFEELWKSGGLREEALKVSVDKDLMIKEARKHPIYGEF